MQTSDFSVSISRIISMMHLPLYMSWSDHLLQSYSLHAIKSTVYLCILIHNCNKCNYLTWLLFFKFLTLKTLKRGRVLSVQLYKPAMRCECLSYWSLGVFVLHWLDSIGMTVYILCIYFVGVDTGSFTNVMVPLRQTKYLLEQGLNLG